MILKIRRSMTHADSCRGVSSFKIIDNIVDADFSEVKLEMRDVDDGAARKLFIDDVEAARLGHQDIIWLDENQTSGTFCQAVVNVRRPGYDPDESKVYYFATEAYLMSDRGQTIERLSPGFKQVPSGGTFDSLDD